MGRKRYCTTGICEDCSAIFDKRQPSGKYLASKRFCDKKCSSHYNALHRPTPTRTPEWNKKIGDAQRGRLGNNWRGGVTPAQKLERQRPEYKAWRELVYQRDDYTCQVCYKRGGNIQADHIKPWIAYPELRLELSNGRTLCVECHKKTPTYARNYKYQVLS